MTLEQGKPISAALGVKDRAEAMKFFPTSSRSAGTGPDGLKNHTE